ncbi:MAG: hypothetical protein KDD55_08850, partial [Bdellovibrionales bacterium]|nr:hypothetical protein [Bdellovibrionales bacterium]
VYDGAALINSSFENLTLLYGYVGNVNRINGDDHPRGDISTQAHLFNGKYVFGSELSATLFSYLLDLTDDVPSLSTVTYGGRLNGASEMDEDLSLLYDASYAYQEDYADNLTSFGASYLAFEGGVSFGDFTAKIGWESLGSDNGTAAFTTPIATLHKFNGWADQFLSTPANGLEDLYGSLSYKISGTDSLLDDTTILAVYHSFQADEGGMDYGTEWDISVTKSLGENYSIGAWYAGYNSDGFAADTDKIMLSFSASFTQS